MGSSKVKKGRAGLAVAGGQEQSADEQRSVERNGTAHAVGARIGGPTTTAAPVSDGRQSQDAATPRDVEVSATAKRRRFTAEYKLRILEEAERCRDTNGIGSLLRREGLYSSHLGKWRQQRKDGSLSALAPRKRGRPAVAPHPDTKRLAQVEREKRRLERRLKQVEALLELQKKSRRSWGSFCRLRRPTSASDAGRALTRSRRRHSSGVPRAGPPPRHPLPPARC